MLSSPTWPLPNPSPGAQGINPSEAALYPGGTFQICQKTKDHLRHLLKIPTAAHIPFSRSGPGPGNWSPPSPQVPLGGLGVCQVNNSPRWFLNQRSRWPYRQKEETLTRVPLGLAGKASPYCKGISSPRIKSQHGAPGPVGPAPADLTWLHPPRPLTCLSLQPGSSSLFYKGTKHALLPATLSARTMSTCLRDPSRPPTKWALADRPHFSPSLSPCHFHHHLTLLRLSMSHLRPPCCQSVNPLSPSARKWTPREGTCKWYPPSLLRLREGYLSVIYEKAHVGQYRGTQSKSLPTGAMERLPAGGVTTSSSTQLWLCSTKRNHGLVGDGAWSALCWSENDKSALSKGLTLEGSLRPQRSS